jgi:hypothetical protein
LYVSQFLNYLQGNIGPDTKIYLFLQYAGDQLKDAWEENFGKGGYSELKAIDVVVSVVVND